VRDSGYTFSPDAFTEFYSRQSIRISHLVEEGYVKVLREIGKINTKSWRCRGFLQENMSFGMVGLLPWIRELFGDCKRGSGF